MQFRIKYIILAVLVAVCVLPVSTKAKTVISMDSAITKGVLPNGLTYYIAVNPTTKGFADFALVQNVGNQKDIAEIPSHLKKNSSVKITDDATIYQFKEMRIGRHKTLLDSTLLTLIQISDRALSPANQAIIVSGDVKAAAVEEKIKMLGLTVPKRQAPPQTASKDTHKRFSVKVLPERIPSVADISLIYTLPTPSKEYMASPAKMVFDIYVRELGLIMTNRLKGAFEKDGIPIASLQCVYTPESISWTNATFNISVSVPSASFDRSLNILARTLSQVRKQGVSQEEFSLGKSRLIFSLDQHYDPTVIMNETYLSRCIDSFLYNSPLYSSATMKSFYAKKDVEITKELSYFNKFASSFLDADKACQLVCHIADGNESSVREDFTAAVTSVKENAEKYIPSYSLDDTLAFAAQPHKLKVKKVTKDKFSSGVLTTYSNGIQMLYKKMPTDGKVYFTLALNGGYGSICGLKRGEGGYLSDYFNYCKIAGLSSQEFMNVLNMYDVSASFEVGLSSMKFSASAPNVHLPFIMKALLSIANDAELDETQIDYYIKSQKFIQTADPVRKFAMIDSLMFPSYTYTTHKLPAALTQESFKKFGDFYKKQFSKINDGIFVVVSDMDEYEARKIFNTYLGGFHTSDVRMVRPKGRSQPISGVATARQEGNCDALDLVYSAQYPLTTENYLTASVVSLLLTQRFREELSEYGLYVEEKTSYTIYPQERFSVSLRIGRDSDIGLYSDVTPLDINTMLVYVRRAAENIVNQPLDSKDIAFYKEFYKDALSRQAKMPVYWLSAISRRYIDGKDCHTDFEAKLKSLPDEKVRELVTSLLSGTCVEYITYVNE